MNLMKPMFVCAAVVLGGMCVQAPQASAAQISAAMRCRDVLAMQQGSPEQNRAGLRANMTAMLKAYAPQGIDGHGTMPSPAMMDMAIDYGTRWCQKHPDATLGQAAAAARRSQGRITDFLARFRNASPQ